VMLLGKATKLSQQLSVSDKDYAGTMILGIETDTQDLEGQILNEVDCGHLSESEIVRVCSGMIGTTKQIPPKYSALKKNGKSLYYWTRKGVEVDRPPREVRIFKFDIDRIDLPEVSFFLSCSKSLI